ncbi:MAG TPA: NADH-quinone oxidoreductase subunit K [Candidatus Aminicenantes bacterium]|nr:NADH-quinone oxidoreductase subunit K [Candidatus Aminicenantes bacterium]HRY64158.1 NADH-quinone oxidoreductase subunit K [Candidatus Aminicenantes bacterium]HRZ71071.1 NADH-quinone oxidoreductase subunit K [Candidatus Aminicenantes bacterium]
MSNTWYLYLFFAAALIGAGVLGLLGKRNLIKLFIAIEVLGKGISLILMGTGLAKASLLTAQALVITYIVIEVSLVATALALIINVYRQTKSLDVRGLSKLKG